ncbi:uncharacterized mitochondrial protein AtMg00300-like [Malania oleifera]|uniref:uncharacterized mitochondrial protein AtMg00300-like n=1 Tax=Malania oleifera TaxID=397392 RepID=UPI0025AE91BB|nr:uncharacterized mitochondrial protein AtMg00300-like [Malania oleifera]
MARGSLVVMKDHLRNNLYALVGSTMTGGAAASTSSDTNTYDTTLWHMRLGHMSEHGLQELHRRNLLGGKHTSKEVLEYIHSDVWVPVQENLDVFSEA